MAKLFTSKLLLLLVAALFVGSVTNAQTRRKTTARKTVVKKAKPTELVGKVGTPVDLGLSVKWASWGVGASSTTDIGAGYYWAETVQCYPNKSCRHDYPYCDYRAQHATKYYHYTKNDSLYTDKDKYTVASGIGEAGKQNPNIDYGLIGHFDGEDNFRLADTDDVAKVKWGEHWRTPTGAELRELRKKCKWELVNNSEEGLHGWRVTGPSGNSIFLSIPAGEVYGLALMSCEAPLSQDSSCFGLSCSTDGCSVMLMTRDNKFSVRPVYVE